MIGMKLIIFTIMYLLYLYTYYIYDYVSTYHIYDSTEHCLETKDDL